MVRDDTSDSAPVTYCENIIEAAGRGLWQGSRRAKSGADVAVVVEQEAAKPELSVCSTRGQSGATVAPEVGQDGPGWSSGGAGTDGTQPKKFVAST